MSRFTESDICVGATGLANLVVTHARKCKLLPMLCEIG